MRPDDFDFISKLIKSRSGLVLTPDKSYLLESRLMPIARKRGWKGLDELVGAMRTKRDEKLAAEVTEAMTTNESFFFRDIKPFDQFRDIVLPHLLQSRAQQKTVRIWCAAASSGQEPYSICMVLKELGAKLAGWKFEILGTDISGEMLEKAKNGLYTQFEVQRGLPIQLLVKYFKKKDDMWQIDPALRSMVKYREFNLLSDMKQLGNFDVVFCRNVLIYFDQPTKGTVLQKIAQQMPDDGFLYLGGAETVLGISDKFKPVQGQRGIYLLNRPGAPDVKAPAAATGAAAGAKPGLRPTGATAGAASAFGKPGAARPAASGGFSKPGTTGTTRPAAGTGTTRPAAGTGTTRPAAGAGTGTTRPGSTTGGTGGTGTAGRSSFGSRPSGTGTSSTTRPTSSRLGTPGKRPLGSK